MDERKVQKILVEILFAELNEAESAPADLQNIPSDMLLSVCRLAKKHDLVHIVSSFVYRNNIDVDETLRMKLQKEDVISVFRHKQMKYAFDEICTVLEENKTPYLPLKGSVIRHYYPSERMRTSCDIDIMIREEDLPVAISTLEKKGYTLEKRGYHDVSLYSPSKVHLELHFNIQENMDNLDVVLRDAWQYAEQKEGSRYVFKKEFFVFYMYAHMAYHFLSGGCGIRSLMDVWVMENKMDAHVSCAEGLLRRAGIYTFAEEMSRISDICFAQKELDEFSDLVLKYIFDGGVYGSYENSIAVFKTKNKSSFAYFLKRLFMPYSAMKELYPILKKVPLLLPVFWVVRWVRAIIGGRSKAFVSEISSSKNVTAENIEQTREICSRLGFENLNK